MRRDGFTLIELMIVVSIIAIILAITIPILHERVEPSPAQRSHARNLRQVIEVPVSRVEFEVVLDQSAGLTGRDWSLPPHFDAGLGVPHQRAALLRKELQDDPDVTHRAQRVDHEAEIRE